MLNSHTVDNETLTRLYCQSVWSVYVWGMTHEDNLQKCLELLRDFNLPYSNEGWAKVRDSFEPNYFNKLQIELGQLHYLTRDVNNGKIISEIGLDFLKNGGYNPPKPKEKSYFQKHLLTIIGLAVNVIGLIAL